MIVWVKRLLRRIVARYSFARYLISGGANTAFTYVVYLVLLIFWDYKISYTVAYAMGIIVSYFLNRVFVFKSHRGWRSILLFPLVYVFQYLASLAILWAWVRIFDLNARLGLLVAIVITVPITYGLSRLVYGRKGVSLE